MKQFPKNFILLLLLSTFVNDICAQRKRLINDGPEDKYFISIAYGTGNASWNSSLNQSALYDTSGSELFSGNVLFNAKNTLNNLNIDVAAQVQKVRIGMGIAFEDFYLEKIKINNTNYAFSDRFTFSKIFINTEVPFQKISGDLFSFSVKGSLGFFKSYYLNHFNLFGGDNNGKSYFFNAGFLADYKLLPHSYIFLQPTFEYKYFRNSKKELPSRITHQIWSYFIMLGIRVDVSKE